MKRLLLVPLLLCAALAASPAFAGDEFVPEGAPAKDGKFCKENPAKCEEWKARHEQFCKNNPETCKQGAAAREKRRAWCDANPKECQKLKEERQARHQKMREWCHANPGECKERREEMKQRRKARSDAFCKEHPEKCDGKPDGETKKE